MNEFLRDLRYSARLLSKNLTFTSAVVLSLAIGIGANAAIFSLINGVLLKPLPFKNSERLVALWEQPFKPRVLFASLSGVHFKACEEQSHAFDKLSAYTDRKEVTLTGDQGAERVNTRQVGGDFFAALEVSPLLGRWFRNDELKEGAGRVAIISAAFWKRHLAARQDVIGTEIILDRVAYHIVGVSPSIFAAMGAPPADVILPLDLNSQELARDDRYFLNVIGRLKTGITVSEAQAQMDVIAARFTTKIPDAEGAPVLKLMSPRGLTVLWYRGLFVTLQAAILFVLLIACTNVASLLLARWTGRQHELAIRAALGASRRSMLRLSLCESLLLVSGGTALGIWLADVFRRALVAVAPADIPRISEVQIDSSVLLGITVLSVCLALFFAFVPFFFSGRIEINDALRQGGRAATAGIGRQRIRSFLVAAQVVLTVVLLSGAGLFIRSLWLLQKSDLGFQPVNLLTFHLSADSARYQSADEIAGFYTRALDRLKAVPGIGEICAGSDPPFSGGAMGNRVSRPGRAQNPGGQMDAQTIVVTPDYFATLGIKWVEGRSFTPGDRAGAPLVVIINETLARHLSSSGTPLDARLELEAAQFPNPNNVSPRTAQVVGVVRDLKQFGVTAPAHNVVYVPFAQNPAPSMFVVAKTQIRAPGLVAAVRAAVSELDPDQPVYDLQMMTERIHASEPERRFNATLLVLFAAVALVASAIGIYGTLAFWVAQRTHEIGIRMALGAGRRKVLSLVVQKVARTILVGIALGFPASFAMVRLVRAFVYQGQPAADMFYGVSSVDPVTMFAVLGVLVGSAAIATAVPAWRATRIDPAQVLQTE